MKRLNFGKLALALALPLVVSFSSCNKDKNEDGGKATRLTVNGGIKEVTLSFAYDETEASKAQEIVIVSNKSWEITNIPSWLTVTPKKGSASDDEQKVSIIPNENNTTGGILTGNMNVKASEMSIKLTVTQAAQPGDAITEINENFEGHSANTNIDLADWTNVKAAGASSSTRLWRYISFDENMYAQASVHNEGTTSDEFELWLITPALNLDGAAEKIFSFKSQGGYFSETSSLEAYVMSSNVPSSAEKTKIDVRVAQESDKAASTDPYTQWVSTGDVSLAAYSGVKYIGIRYKAMGGSGNSTTYCVDDFKFGISVNSPEFNVPTLEKETVSAESSVEVFVQGNVAWTAELTEGSAFATIEDGSGDGAGSFKVNFTANTSTTDTRTAKVKVSTTANVPTKQYEVTIVQSRRVQGVTSGVYTSTITMPAMDNKAVPTNAYGAFITIGSNTYETVKLGKSSENGSYEVTVPNVGTILSFYSVAWRNSTNGELTIAIGGGGTIDGETSKTINVAANDAATGSPAGNPMLYPTAFTITDDTDYHQFTLSGITETSTITFSNTGARLFFFGVNVTAQ